MTGKLQNTSKDKTLLKCGTKKKKHYKNLKTQRKKINNTFMKRQNSVGKKSIKKTKQNLWL